MKDKNLLSEYMPSDHEIRHKNVLFKGSCTESSPLQHVPDYTRYLPVLHHWTPETKLSQKTTDSCHTADRRNSTDPNYYTADS